MSRKLDAAIAEVLGYEVCKGNRTGLGNYWIEGDKIIPRYSTDGNAIVDLDDELSRRGWGLAFCRSDSDEYIATYYRKNSDYCVTAKGMDEIHTRALAGYKALVWKELG